MRSLVNSTDRFGPVAVSATSVRVRERSSYLGSRWIQAPIFVAREADT